MLDRHSLRTPLALLALTLAVSACASRPAESDPRSASSQPPTTVVAEPELAPEPEPEDQSYVLNRGLHGHDMTEAVLDARAESALTLDAAGGVRLWAQLGSANAKTPWVLPVHEPARMSLSRAADGSIVVAFVDTAGGGRVARVELSGDGAVYVPLFEIPVTEPIFELHALDGGQRILGLRVDHRVELFDAAGTVVSAIDEPGFVPWQLRVSERAGQAPSIVAVLAGPTRVQPIALGDDGLVRQGTARTVVIDRGPNRNDLSLSPDGTTVAALRKPRSRKPRITIELVDLQTDERRLIVAETDDRRLPRLHWVDDSRLLLESGTGQGLWVDLASAIPWTGETGREETDEVEAVALPQVVLPASRDSLRSQASVVAGLRAVPTPHALVLDALDDAYHVRLGSDPHPTRAVALDADGGRVAWSRGSSVVLEDLDDATAPRVLDGVDAAQLGFVGEDRLLMLGSSGKASLLDYADGAVVTTADLGLASDRVIAAYVGHGTRGRLAAIAGHGRGLVHAVEVTEQGFGPLARLPSTERLQWPELGMSRRDRAAIVESLGYEGMEASDVRDIVVDARGRHHLVGGGVIPALVTLEEGQVQQGHLRAGQVTRMVPDPQGDRLAVVQRVRQSEVFVDFERVTDFDEYAVSVVDLRTQERLWTRATTGFTDLSWSGDGRRVAIAGHDGGQVIEVSSGAVRLHRRHLGLTVQRVADAQSAD